MYVHHFVYLWIFIINVITPLKDGKTSLSISAYRGHVEVATLFCERGANINARDNVSKSATKWQELYKTSAA